MTKKDRFAHLLSEGLPIPVICERMGMTRNSGYSMLAKLKKDLGWQAQ